MTQVMLWLLGATFLLTACGNAIHDVGAAKLVPAIPQTGSALIGFAEDRRFTVEMPDDRKIMPVPMIEPGAAPVRRAPGSRVYLAGSADGTAPIEVDDFLLIEVQDPSKPSGIRQLVAGEIGLVRRQGIPIDSIYDHMPIPAGALDLTDFIPACTITMVGAVPMDLGTIAQSTPIYLIVDYPDSDWAKESCAAP